MIKDNDSNVDYGLLVKLKNCNKKESEEENILYILTSLKKSLVEINASLLKIQDEFNRLNEEKSVLYKNFTKLTDIVALHTKNNNFKKGT